MIKKTEIKSYCRVCEPMCGVIATLEDGRITKMASNPDHAFSQGHFCKKAMGAVDITNDPDRILYPMKRAGGPGEFKRISWEQAYSEIAERLGKIRSKYGADALANYTGNPPYFSYANVIANDGFKEALGIKWRYGVNGEDGNALLASAEYVYGSMSCCTKPDLWRTSFVLIIGANPLGSHASIVIDPNMNKVLKGIVLRGGRVVVVDPRCTQTAQKYEYTAIRSGSDAWFLTALLREVIDQGYADQGFIKKNTRGFEQLRAALDPCTAEWAEEHSGISAQTIRDLARDFGTAPNGASVLSRTGTSTQRYGTFCHILLQLLVIVTGNLDREGGHSFSWGLMDIKALLGDSKIGDTISRTTGLPEIAGQLPSKALISDITTPGEGQIKALFLHGGNPALQSAAAGPEMDAALQELELIFSIDIYMNETNRFADYILPAATMWEREDVPIITLTGMMLRPSVYATPALIDKSGEAEDEWKILNEICRRMGVGAALPKGWMRGLAKLGFTITPRHLMDLIIRTSTVGDKFGLKPKGLSFDKLINDYPDGVELMKNLPVGIFDQWISTPDKRVDLASSVILSELNHLKTDTYYLDPTYPLRLHTMREVLSHNSWMHNVGRLTKSNWAFSARIHPEDAAQYGVTDGDKVCICSPYGEIETVVSVTDKESVGNIALPHGLGHNGGWKAANARGGVNSNLLSSTTPTDTDRIGASSILNGIPVNIRKVQANISA